MGRLQINRVPARDEEEGMEGSIPERRTFRRVLVIVAVAATTLLTVLLVAPSAYATFPGNNGRIAFSLDRGSGSEIYTIRRNGNGLRRPTT